MQREKLKFFRHIVRAQNRTLHRQYFMVIIGGGSTWKTKKMLDWMDGTKD